MSRVHRLRFLMPVLGLALLALAAAAPAADAGPYRLDPVHTRVMLAVDHAGFSKAIGTVSGATGELWSNGQDWTGARVEVAVPLDRLDFGDADWNRAVGGRGLLDTARHPVAHFVSTRIEAVDAGRAIVHGQLTLKGVTREVALDAVRNGARRHPLPPFRQTIGFSATTLLSRADFGIDAWRSMIGDAIELRLEVEATRARAGRDVTTPPAGAIDAEPPADDEAEIEAAPPQPEPEPPPTSDDLTQDPTLDEPRT